VKQQPESVKTGKSNVKHWPQPFNPLPAFPALFLRNVC